jgi:hypothetical protein
MKHATSLLATLLLTIEATLPAATVEVIKSGKVVNLAPPDPGYVFETIDGNLSLKGTDMTFFVSARLGDQFKATIRMAIENGGKSKPAVILNGVNVVSFDGNRVGLDGLNLFERVMGRQIPWKPTAPASVSEGKTFELEIRRWKKDGAKTASFAIRIDRDEILEIPDLAAAVDSIALRPGNAVMRIESFTLTGDAVGGEIAASSAADAALKLKDWKKHQAALPSIDLSRDSTRHVFVAEGTAGMGHFHPHTALLSDKKTIIAAWAIGHRGHAGSVARSEDGGLTWKRIDEAMPPNFENYQCGFFFQMTDPAGKERLWHIGTKTLNRVETPGRMRGYMPRLVSEDDGKTWREEKPLSPYPDETFNAIGPFWSVVRLKDGSYIGQGHRFSKEGPLEVYQSATQDGGFTWSEPRTILQVEGKDPCEPFVFRAPDGAELCSLIRENQRAGTSLVMFSKDEGKTWSPPVDTPWGLTGDRHQAVQLPDGRLVIVFRDMAPGSPWRFKFIAWVGTYEDIKQGRPGQYRVKLMHSYADCGYAGIHQLADGTVVATTYGKYWDDERKHSIVSVRFKMSEIDALAVQQLK